ncbi:hypothetical protein BH23BAC1_BH23BAC1_42570 [soil metagenome]
MKESNLVSVIIPVYNRFDLARRAIKSVILQDYRPIEIIVIDDFSQNKFEFNDHIGVDDNVEISIIRNEVNLGPGGSREIGRKTSKGEFLVYLDSDDSYHPDFLKTMVSYLQDHPDIDMAYCHAKFMSSDGAYTDESVKRTFIKYDHILPHLIIDGRPWHSSGCIRRKRLTDKIGPWKPLNFWEDYEYDSRAGLANNRLGYIPDVLCYIDKDSEGKITRNPDTPRKNKSYGLSIYNIAKNLNGNENFMNDIRNRVIYHLLKSSARNLDNKSIEIAKNNVKESLHWIKVHKRNYLILLLVASLNFKIFSPIVSRVIRKMSNSYKFR